MAVNTNSLSFGGGDEVVDIGKVSSLIAHGTNDCGMSVWVLDPATSTDNQSVIHYGVTGAANKSRIFIDYAQSDGADPDKARFFIGNGSGNSFVVSNIVLTGLGAFRHLFGFRYNGVLHLWNNGVRQTDNTANTINLINESDGRMYLGAQPKNGGQGFLTSNASQFAVIGAAFSSGLATLADLDAAVLNVYLCGLSKGLAGVITSGLLGAWPVDGDTISSITDVSGNGNNGTPLNMESGDVTTTVPVDPGCPDGNREIGIVPNILADIVPNILSDIN